MVTRGLNVTNDSFHRLETDIYVDIIWEGSDKAKPRKFIHDPLFHIPIIGGWKEYVVLGPIDYGDFKWHIGWHVSKEGESKYSQLNIKPINDYGIKVLKGPKNFDVNFFAYNENGSQIELKYFDEGRSGDKKYSNLRLF